MTGREKILAALSAAGTLETPLVVCYPEIVLRDQWERITGLPWWMMESDDIEVGLRVTDDLLAATGDDWVQLQMSRRRGERGKFRWEGGADGTAKKIDVVTGAVEILQRPPPGGFVFGLEAFTGAARTITSREQIDELLPLPAEETAATLADGRDEGPRRIVREFGQKYLPWVGFSSPFERLPFVWGFEGLMAACAERPELVEYGAERALAVSLRELETWRLLGVELVWIQECLSDQISPEQYRRFALPYLQELTAAVRAAGMQGIYYFCGNPNDRLELLLASGAEGLALEESKKGFVIDIAEVAAQVAGRVALVGNLDAIGLLERGPAGAIRAEVGRQIEAGRRLNGGRFLMGIGSPVTPGTPVEHLRVLSEAVRELRKESKR